MPLKSMNPQNIISGTGSFSSASYGPAIDIKDPSNPENPIAVPLNIGGNKMAGT